MAGEVESVDKFLAHSEQLKQEIHVPDQYLEELGVVWDEILRKHWVLLLGPDMVPAPAADNLQLFESAISQEVSGDRGAVSAKSNAPSSIPYLPY